MPKQNSQGQSADSSKIQAPKLSLPKGGGAIQGIGETFQANEFSGTADLSVPIFASPCRDFTPALALSYSSGTGNGLWGLGFSLSIPQISRQTRKGTPQYQDKDVFVLSGSADLVPLGQAPRTDVLRGITYTIQTFAPRQEGLFALIEYWKPQEASQSFWKVTGKDHTISIFGKTNQAKITDPGNPDRIFSWLLEESYNTMGDHQLFCYKQENADNIPTEIYEQNHAPPSNRYIERIQYGNEKPIAGSILLDEVVVDPRDWHFEVVFDYGEYKIEPSNPNPYDPVNKWACRPDPFSMYEAGFEIRTYRRCLHTLMFHRFPAELGDKPVLVQATAYGYEGDEKTQLSKCISIIQTGYSYDANQKVYTTAALPPLAFTYTLFQPEGHAFVQLTDEQRGHLSGLNETPNYTLVDLYGEGIPGILYSDKAVNYYRTPHLSHSLPAAQQGPYPLSPTAHTPGEYMYYGDWEVLTSFPSQREVAGEEVMLQDLVGNGKLDVVLTGGRMPGYWEAQPDRSWASFRSLPAWPVDFPAPSQTWVDLTGDGIPDLVQLTAEQVLVYPSVREKGLARPIVQPKAPGMPPSLAGSPVEVIRFADMAGSGQAHLVRIRNGEVVYWPNLSYGRFGAPITMDNAPNFGADFNPTQLFLADLDGSGTMDLIYIQANQAFIYLNQSGNSFQELITLPLPVTFDRLDQVTFADIYGRGNECLVLSEPLAVSGVNARYWCYDFCQGQKPYLIGQIINNLGASTEITYGSSVDFYLADKRAGLPWITSLPFPVHVITQITHTDEISGSRYVSQYAYHHGYYDGVEREFRGFGRVDRQDAEYFPSSQVDPMQDPSYVAPTLSRTWYHTGSYKYHDSLTQQYEKEYYKGDKDAFKFPDSTIDWNHTQPDEESIRQAYVALAGTVLRSEVYGLDNSPLAKNPYSASESNFRVVLKQLKGAHPYAIFYVHSEQSLAYTYERNINKDWYPTLNPHLHSYPLLYPDPQIHQTCVLLVDDYGNVERSCAITYPRRNVEGALPEQQQLKVTCATQSYVKPQITPESYLIGVPIESHSYEISGLTPIAGAMFSYEELQQSIDQALKPSSKQAKLLGWEQYYYMQVSDQGTNTLLPLGKVALPLLIGEHHVAEFSQQQVTDALQETPLTGEKLIKKLQEGYYQLDTTSGYWWNTGLTAQYYGPDHFYFSLAIIDPAGNQTTYAYDSHHLLLTQVTDALHNVIKIQAIDYQHLHPTQLVDPNDNTSEVKLDPLGRVIYTSHYGHEAGKAKGFAPISEAPNIIPTDWSALIAAVKDNTEATYLGKTQSYFYYDPFAWIERREPVGSLSLIAEQYPDQVSVPPRIQVHITYNDGFGRTLCSKSKVESGEAFLYDPKTHQITTGETQDRWLTAGRVVYNNKGNPVKQYEPYFINTPDYVSNPVLDTFGVSPIIYYDPLDRVTHTITPKGFLQAHTWTPWEEVAHDAHDKFLNSPYCQVNVLQIDDKSVYYDADLSEADRKAIKAVIDQKDFVTLPTTALGKALVYAIKYFQDTPSRSILDNLGHTIITERINKSQDKPEGEMLRNYYTYDILGRELTSADPRLHAVGKHNFETTYSLTGQVLKVISADAGKRWSLTNTLGNPIWSYDERQVTMTPAYDELHRPTHIHVLKKPVNDQDTLALDQVVERFIYGDTPGAVPNPAANNLRGQVYQHYDQAGLVTIPSYSLLGAPLSSQRRFKVDYKEEASWVVDNSDGAVSLLQPKIYQEQNIYDALGRITQHKDVDDNRIKPIYHQSGWLNQIKAIPQQLNNQPGNNGTPTPLELPVVQGVTYNAKGQRLSISYDNNTTTTYTYDSKTWALTNLKTVNKQGKVLQDLVYVYDPAGNVVAKTDKGQNTIYYKNQEVNSTATYTYDSLYRLIQGTGREKIGNTGDKAGREIPLIPSAPHPHHHAALQNYIEKYTYDQGNNLVQTKHIAQQDSWTRKMVVSPTSNRAVISTINGEGKPIPLDTIVDQYFDNHGNQIQTQQFAPLAWNYRNNLQKATVMQHTDGTQDAEYYVYDGGGQRVRKVSEQYGEAGQVITFRETLYVGQVEYRRTLQGKDLAAATVQEAYYSLRIMDDQQCVATRDYWKVGKPPTGFDHNPVWRYHLDDHLGSCTVEIDDQGNQISYEEYSPYGTSLLFIGTGSASQLKCYRYSSQERDSVTGFYYYGARYYAPWLGRWLSPDPAGTVNGLNIYAFVQDDPTTHKDVGGMATSDSEEGEEEEEKIKEPERISKEKSGAGPSSSQSSGVGESSGMGSGNEEEEGKVSLIGLKLGLTRGPLFMGESHKLPLARQAIMDLIEQGSITNLFLELPSLSKSPPAKGGKKGDEPRWNKSQAKKLEKFLNNGKRKEKQLQQSFKDILKNHCSSVFLNRITMYEIIKTAIKAEGISVYFHDVPQDLTYGGLKPGRKYLINGKWTKDALFLKERNEYSAKLIAKIIKKYGEVGTIVLAGNHHLVTNSNLRKVEDTLQSLVAEKLLKNKKNASVTYGVLDFTKNK